MRELLRMLFFAVLIVGLILAGISLEIFKFMAWWRWATS